MTETATQEASGKRRGRNPAQAPELDPVDTTLFEPVERQVYRSIRRSLMRGLIAPDSVLTSRSLAHELKVSIQPVRDALKRLEADGVLEGRPQSGFFLRKLSRNDYWEITEIRQRLEGLAGRYAAAGIAAEEIDRLIMINARLRELKITHDYLALNHDFHFTIYSAAGRPTLLALIENFWVRIGPVLHHHPHEYNHAETQKNHDAIIDALARRDPDATEEAISRDLGDAAQLVALGLPETGEHLCWSPDSVRLTGIGA